MTREQQIDWLCRLKSEIKIFMPYQWQKPFEEALDMAIKAPNQEPNKSENPTGSIIDWNNCHTSEQLESISTTKNNLGVDKEQLKTMIRGLTKWYVKRDNTEVGEPNTAVGLLYDDVMFGIDRLSPVTSIRPKGHWIEEFNDIEGEVRFTCSSCGKYQLFGTDFCYNCGSDNREVVEE